MTQPPLLTASALDSALARHGIEEQDWSGVFGSGGRMGKCEECGQEQLCVDTRQRLFCPECNQRTWHKRKGA